MKLLLTFFLLFVVAQVNAQYGLTAQRCSRLDLNGNVRPEFYQRHLQPEAGLCGPNQINNLNYTILIDPVPGVTTWTPVANFDYFQHNTYYSYISGCAYQYLKIDEPMHDYWNFGIWVGDIHLDQELSKPYPGQNKITVPSCYSVTPVPPVMFSQIGATVLDIVSCNTAGYGTHTYMSYEGNLVLSEVLVQTGRSLGQFDEAFYSNVFPAGSEDGYAQLHNIHRRKLNCDDYEAGSRTFRACRAMHAYYNGEATLQDDPVALAAGVEGYKVLTWVGPDFVAAKRDVSAVKWPQTPEAMMSYHMISQGNVDEVKSLPYMEGMPVSEDVHHERFSKLI